MDSWDLNCVTHHSHPTSPVLSCPGNSNVSPFCPQHSVTLVPVEEFSAEFVEPRVFCVSSHGTFNPGR